MSATIIDGRAIASRMRHNLKQEVARLQTEGITPGLAVLLVGNDPASHTYVNGKAKACSEVGIRSQVYRLPETTTEEELLKRIDSLNNDPTIHGILVQLPFPDHISPDKVITSISPDKDVDGFHPLNVGRLMTGQPSLIPCTPHGILHMIRTTGESIAGKHAVVVGRSNIVGKPMAMLLLQEHATVTICHSKTKDLASITRQAELLVVACGQQELIGPEHVAPGALVIDVGIHRTPSGKLVGDVRFEDVKEKAGYITPVPGGVGPMTITMLLYNTLQAARKIEQG